MVKLGIVAFLAFIVYSLFSGFYYLLIDRSQGDRVVKALAWRIGASVLLIGLIGAGIATGVVEPHGLQR